MVTGIHRINVFSYHARPSACFKNRQIEKGPCLFDLKKFQISKFICRFLHLLYNSLRQIFPGFRSPHLQVKTAKKEE